MSEKGPDLKGPGFEAMKPLHSQLGYRKRMGQGTTEIPMPPLEMRQLAGPTDPALFDNPSGRPVFPHLPVSAYDAVFDFGCGCGRIARQLLQQQPRPTRYVGVDIHRGMIEWCQNNLTPVDGNFAFQHHDVFNPSHGPENTRRLTAPFEVEDSAFSLVVALSAFTYLHQHQITHYLREIARILRPDGRFISAWFLFDKSEFPMMKPSQNTLSVDGAGRPSAIIYDRNWLREMVTTSGLAIVDVDPPSVRGSSWSLVMTHHDPGLPFIEFPPDKAPYGSASKAPVGKKRASDKEVWEAISEVEHWYHRIQVAPGIFTPGVNDSEAALEAMEVPERLDGQRVLDVGARDGYFSFVAEARGAEVLAMDAVAPELTGFSTAAEFMESSVEYRTMNVNDVRPEETGTFDAIFFLGVLYHLRDPMLALDRLWEVARPGATIWVESHVIDQKLVDPETGEFRDLDSVAPKLVDVPIAQFYPGDILSGDRSNWWGPNLAGLEAMVESAGFEVVRSRLIGTRGLVVGRKTEDKETSFFREFDRAIVTERAPLERNGELSVPE